MSEKLPLSLKNAKTVRCPQCGGQALYHPSNSFRPFCSERCKMIDLGAWANDEYAVPGSPLETPLVDDNPITPQSSGHTLQ